MPQMPKMVGGLDMLKSFFTNYRLKYQKKYLLQRILFLYSFTIILFALVLFSISAIYYLNTMKQLAHQELERIHERISRIAEDKERLMDTFTDSLNNNKEAMNDIISYFSDDYSNYITQKLDRYYISDSIAGIDFKSSAKTFFANDPSYQYSEISQKEDALTYLSDYSSHLESAFVTSRPLNFSKNNRQIGTIKSYFDFSDFERVTSSEQTSFTVILSPTGQLIWQAENTPETITEIQSLLVTALAKEKSEITIHNVSYYIAAYRTKNHTTLVTFYQVPNVRTFFSTQPLFVTLLFLLMITFFIALLMRLFKKYTQQIDSIVAEMTTNTDDALTTHLRVDDKEAELKTVSETFNQLIDHINDHVEKSYVLELKQKDAELRSLQSQINPHFLYNTLEFIRMSALKDGNDELSEMVYILGQLFRNSITQQKETTLFEEVESSKLYMKLFQTKHPNKIAYQFSLEPDVEQLVLPKFIIQPLIENYVLHGIDYKKRNNVIQLKAFKNQQKLIIQIIDNGKGIAPGQLEKMKNYLNGIDDSLESVGFKNVNERLKIFFGEDYQMKLTSIPNKETCIQLIITLKENAC